MILIGTNEGTNNVQHNSWVYKRDCKCHRLTKKGFLPIFTSDKMKRTNGIPKLR